MTLRLAEEIGSFINQATVLNLLSVSLYVNPLENRQ